LLNRILGRLDADGLVDEVAAYWITAWAAGSRSRSRRPRESRAAQKSAWAAIALGADPDIRRSIGTHADRARGERIAEPGAPAVRTHEHLGDFAAAVVRLHLSEPRWTALLHRRDHAHVREFSHLAGLRVEGLGLRVVAEVLPMPYLAELTHRVVVHLDELAATLRRHATVMEHVHEWVRYPPPLAELAHHPVGHGDHPLDVAVGAVDELAIGRRDHFPRVHRSVQPNAVVLPVIRVARTPEHRPVGERPHLLAHPLRPTQMPLPEPFLAREPRHSWEE
jgi:hypothetical protein